MNVATINELGRTKRSSHKENKVGRGDLGALILRLPDGTEFSCGTGFSDVERELIWNNRDTYLGKLVSFDHFPIGVKDKPRHPSYKGLRDPIDL
jgi:DNA ligase-1